MSNSPLVMARDDPNRWRIGAAGLALAAIVVGIAIVLGGTPARVLNPIGALLWVASGVLLAVSLSEVPRTALGWLVAIGSGLLLGAVIRPATLPEAVLWFAVLGAIVVIMAGDRLGAWALLIPAIYLPVHLIIGIGRAIARGGSLRTDPPPTAAILPLAMVLAAAAAGAMAASFLRREHS